MPKVTYQLSHDTLTVTGDLNWPLEIRFVVETQALVDSVIRLGLTDVAIDLRKGLPPLRLEWTRARGDVETYPGLRVPPADAGAGSPEDRPDRERFPASSGRSPLRAR